MGSKLSDICYPCFRNLSSWVLETMNHLVAVWVWQFMFFFLGNGIGGWEKRLKAHISCMIYGLLVLKRHTLQIQSRWWWWQTTIFICVSETTKAREKKESLQCSAMILFWLHSAACIEEVMMALNLRLRSHAVSLTAVHISFTFRCRTLIFLSFMSTWSLRSLSSLEILFLSWVACRAAWVFFSIS